MAQCPVCGGSLDLLGECAICGYKSEEKVDFKSTLKTDKKQEREQHISFWGGASLLLINVCILITILNICLGGFFWAHYVSIGAFTVCLVAYSVLSRNIKQIAARTRYTLFFLNVIAWLYVLIVYFVGQDFDWIWMYYIPSMIIVANIILFVLLFFKKISLTNMMITYILNLMLSICPLIAMIFLAHSTWALGLIVSAFSISLLSSINLMFIKFVHWKHQLTEKFIK